MNIFVVEDERWALAELVELFKSYEPDHCVFAFENGDDALSAAAAIHPHLVLTDINMPGIDGLELIEQLHRLDPTIKSMILSVHDQFEYARQGMKYGVVDYLLKPVKKDALYKAVDKAIQHIGDDSKRRVEWMNGSIAQMLLAADDPEYDVLRVINGHSYCLVLFLLDKGSELKNWKDTPLCFNELNKQFAHPSYSQDRIHCVDLDCRQRVVLIPITASSQVGRIKEKLEILYQQLQQFPSLVHFGYSIKSAKETLYEVFSELKQTLEEQMNFGMPTFLQPGMKHQDVEIGVVWDKVRVMEIHFKKGELLKGQAVLQQILGELRQKQISKRQLRLLIQDLLFSLKYNLLSSKIGKVSINEIQEDIRKGNEWASYSELFEWLNGKIVSIYGSQETKDANPKILIAVLLQLIHNNYQGSISLQQFAADHHVSIGYLSRMFKSQTGSTFSDYIAGYRIRKAKELLSSGIERLQEVSRLVGYEDVKHFSALFKKIVGQTPITYARKNPPR